MENLVKSVDSEKEVVEVSVLSLAVSNLLKIIRNVPVKTECNFLKRVKLVFSKDIVFLKATEHSDLLMNVDKLELELKEVQKQLDTSISMKNRSLELANVYKEEILSDLQAKKSEILTLTVDNRNLTIDINNKIDSINKLQIEIDAQATVIDIKTDTVNEKTVKINALIKSNDKLIERLGVSKKEVSRLTEELKDINANFNNKLTAEIRNRCKASANAILKDAKFVTDENIPCDTGNDVVIRTVETTPELITLEDLVKVEPEFNINKRAVPAEKVIGMRKLLSEGKRKFEIQAIYPEISKSTVLRICNNESYTEDMYQYVPEEVIIPEVKENKKSSYNFKKKVKFKKN